MATTKTDNDFTKNKIYLRANHLPDGDLKVLDCFHGKGVIWRGVQQTTKRKIKLLAIDERNDVDDGFFLHGDNEEFLSSMDLSKFNVIDLDAYGVPYQQLKIIFKKKYTGTVFVTFIQTMYGQMPFGLLQEIGFSKQMIEKIPSLFAKRGWEYFKQWLSMHGVSKISHRSINRKHYLYFNCAGKRV